MAGSASTGVDDKGADQVTSRLSVVWGSESDLLERLEEGWSLLAFSKSRTTRSNTNVFSES